MVRILLVLDIIITLGTLLLNGPFYIPAIIDNTIF